MKKQVNKEHGKSHGCRGFIGTFGLGQPHYTHLIAIRSLLGVGVTNVFSLQTVPAHETSAESTKSYLHKDTL